MKTIIEAGHFYECNGPSNVSLYGWNIGQELAAESGGKSLLFVDDFHGTQPFVEDGEKFFDPVSAQQTKKEMMAEADHIFYEGVLSAGATPRAVELLENGLIKLKKGVSSVGGVRLGRLRRFGIRQV